MVSVTCSCQLPTDFLAKWPRRCNAEAEQWVREWFQQGTVSKQTRRKRARAEAGMNRFRSLLTRRAKKAENYLGLLHFVCGLIAYRAAGLFG